MVSMYLSVRDSITHHSEYGSSITKIDHIRKQSTHTPFLRLLTDITPFGYFHGGQVVEIFREGGEVISPRDKELKRHVTS